MIVWAGGSYASTLDNGASRVEFWNSRAAWFATVYARLAQMGVAAMGASQFFGFDTATAEKFGWLGPEGQCSNGGKGVVSGWPQCLEFACSCLTSGAGQNPYCGYPCLSSLNWDDATPNPRYHTLKMLIEQMRGSATKHIYNASISGPTAAAAVFGDGSDGPVPPPPPPASLFTAVGFEFVGDGARRLILVNGANHSADVTVKWSGGATVTVIDAEHGHGLIGPANSTMVAGAGGELSLSLGRYAIAVLAGTAARPLRAKLDDRHPRQTAAKTAESQGPCDILAAAGNPCVAAHSTVRALYAHYDGPLYTVFRNQSGQALDVYALAPGGFADAKQHESLCPAEGECVIARVMDQSGNGNHLTPRDDTGVPQAGPPGAAPRFGHKHDPVDASKHKLHVARGTEVYGMYFDHGMGYNNNRTRGVATGDGAWPAPTFRGSLGSHTNLRRTEEETIYAVMSGKRWGNRCCFDYGNSEADDKADGAGAMEAIFWGAARWRGNTGYAEPGCVLAAPEVKNGSTNFSVCDGATPETSENCCGPWLGADLESGMYYGMLTPRI